MYEHFFHLKENPFTIAPNPRYLYLSEQHREALAHLTYGLKEENGGFILLVGDVGTGKTTVCRCMLEQIPETAKVAVVLNPRLNEVELLETICDEFSVEYPQNAAIKNLIDALNTWLLHEHSQGRRAVVVVEEAQNLNAEVLEQLRLLTNLETNEHKLLQVVLIGQSELAESLNRPEWQQLAQRIVAHYHLKPLNHNEVRAYIMHRLEVAGGDPELFSPMATMRIMRLSKGIPRVINLICDRALLGCYTQGKHKLDMKTLEQAAGEVFGRGKSTSRTTRTTRSRLQSRWKKTPALATGIAVFALAAALIYLPASGVQPKWLNAITNYDWGTKIASIQEILSPKPSEQSVETSVTTLQLPSSENTLPTTQEPVKELSWTALQSGYWGESPAYNAVFERWGVREITADSYATPCEIAQQHALDCWHKRGLLSDIQRLNRPVVLKMHSPAGKVFYVALLEINRNVLRLGVNQQELELSASTVIPLWSGEYTVVWKRPAGYTRTVRPGDSSILVPWLRKQVGQVSGQAVSQTTGSSVYDTNLMAKVRQLQRVCRLQVDGLLGRETIIMFNTINSKTPVLLSNSSNACPRRLNV